MSSGDWLVIGLSAVLIAWYIVGYIVNRSRAEHIYRWLRAGLKPWGQLTAGERLGTWSAGGRLAVTKPVSPFRQVDVIFLLEPRENVLFWIFSMLRGKRDTLILRINLRKTRPAELELARQGDREFQQIVSQAKKPFSSIPAPTGYKLVSRSENNETAADVLAFIEKYSPAIQRVSLRKREPHLLIRANLPQLTGQPAEEFFAAILRLVTPNQSKD